MRFLLVREIPGLLLYNIERAGVVLMMCIESETYFGFGIDRASGELSDFGGQRKEMDLDPVDTALREFYEESKRIYIVSREDIQDCKVVLGSKDLVLFLPVPTESDSGIPLSPEVLSESFNKIPKSPHDEMSSIVWLTDSELRRTLLGKGDYTMYWRLLNTLMKVFT